MESTLKEKQAVAATLEIQLTAAEVSAGFDAVLGEYARRIRVPGFRPGKVPRRVLIAKLGRDALAEEVREHLVDRHYPAAVRSHELAPIHAHAHGGTPTEGEAFTFDVHVDLYPDVDVGDLLTVPIDVAVTTVSDDDVQGTISRLRSDHATLVPVEGAIEPGTVVSIDLLGEDDQPREGSAPSTVDLETVSDTFAEQFLGRTIDEVFDLRVEDPTVEGEDGAPGTSTLRVRVADVKAKEKPELDDEFAKTLGFERWTDVEKAVRERHDEEAASTTAKARREAFVDALVERTDVALPTVLVERRKANYLEDLAQDLKRRGSTLEAYVASLQAEERTAEFESELQTSAERAVKRDLVLERLLEVRGTEVSDETFQDAVRYMAARERKDPATFMRERGDDWLHNYRFLLRRDAAVREVVAEIVGEPVVAQPGDAGDEADAATEASA